MIPDIPPFGRVLVSFISMPRVDFSLKIGDGGQVDMLNIEPIARAVKRVHYSLLIYLRTLDVHVIVVV
jgi:hypothetical protein